MNFFFVRTYQDGTTVAACKFDSRIGQLQRWRCLGTTSMSGAGTTLRVFGQRVGIAATPAHIH